MACPSLVGNIAGLNAGPGGGGLGVSQDASEAWWMPNSFASLHSAPFPALTPITNQSTDATFPGWLCLDDQGRVFLQDFDGSETVYRRETDGTWTNLGALSGTETALVYNHLDGLLYAVVANSLVQIDPEDLSTTAVASVSSTRGGVVVAVDGAMWWIRSSNRIERWSSTDGLTGINLDSGVTEMLVPIAGGKVAYTRTDTGSGLVLGHSLDADLSESLDPCFDGFVEPGDGFIAEATITTTPDLIVFATTTDDVWTIPLGGRWFTGHMGWTA